MEKQEAVKNPPAPAEEEEEDEGENPQADGLMAVKMKRAAQRKAMEEAEAAKDAKKDGL